MGKKRRIIASRTGPETPELTSQHGRKERTTGKKRTIAAIRKERAKEKKRKIAASGTGLKTAEHQKKPKLSHSQVAESPGIQSKTNSGLDNPLANENQKLEIYLSAENMKKKKKKKKKKNKSRSSTNSINREIFKQKGGIAYFEGKPLDELFEKLSGAIEAAELKRQVHDNIWMKQNFSVGINDVTRTLERMPIAKAIQNNIPDIKHPELVPETFDHFTTSEDGDVGPNKQSFSSLEKAGKQVVHLQAVLTAIDCHPQVLVSHFPGLASSRDVPLLCIEDHGRGSLRLGQLLKLKRAGAIGVKVGETTINKAIQDIIDDQSTWQNTKVAVEPSI